jgi:membrane-associated phospholipid phosphatase
LAATIATALLSAAGFPLVDDDLIAIDKLLGFQWLDVWSLVQAHGATHWWLNLIYYSLDWQPFLISVLLFVIDRGDRCWTMINAWVGGLVLATLIFPIAPAKGALIYYDVARGTGLHPSAFFRIMQGIRDGSIRAIDNHSVVGMVTFPSFHAAAGVYLAWGAWSVPWLRWPFLMLNGAMIISAIPIGGHYLIDIVGGIAVALITIAAAKRYQQYLRCSK